MRHNCDLGKDEKTDEYFKKAKKNISEFLNPAMVIAKAVTPTAGRSSKNNRWLNGN